MTAGGLTVSIHTHFTLDNMKIPSIRVQPNDPSMKRILTLLVPSLAALACSGCLVAAVGAGIGAVKYGSAAQKKAYAEYVTGANANNTEREKAGLTPVPVLTYDEWRKGHEAAAKP